MEKKTINKRFIIGRSDSGKTEKKLVEKKFINCVAILAILHVLNTRINTFYDTGSIHIAWSIRELFEGISLLSNNPGIIHNTLIGISECEAYIEYPKYPCVTLHEIVDNMRNYSYAIENAVVFHYERNLIENVMHVVK